MSNRQFEDAAERRQDAYIAGRLGVTVEMLDDYPYQIDENASDDGLVYSWRIMWEDTAPEGVTVYGEAGSLWSEVQPGGDESDERE